MKWFLLSLLIFISANCPAQGSSEVEHAVRDHVDGFYYGDSLKIHYSISEDVIKQGYYYLKGHTEYIKDTMTYRQCIEYAVAIHKKGVSPNVEKFSKKIEVFDVLDKTASAKLTAWWGTDYILLSKINGHWLITHVLWQSPPLASN